MTSSTNFQGARNATASAVGRTTKPAPVTSLGVPYASYEYLEKLADRCPLAILSNGSPDMLDPVVANAGLQLDAVLSVDTLHAGTAEAVLDAGAHIADAIANVRTAPVRLSTG